VREERAQNRGTALEIVDGLEERHHLEQARRPLGRVGVEPDLAREQVDHEQV
jgi:hypothetical protein